MSTFGRFQLANMVGVGAIGPRSVRLWMRSEKPGEHRIEVWPVGDPSRITAATTTIPDPNDRDNTHSVLFPDDFGLAPLDPLHRYGYRVTRVADGGGVGTGGFETAPENAAQTPARFSIASMSCHQPFNTDGELSDRSMRMLRLVPRILEDHDVKFVLLTGDQIYADHPPDFSLLSRHYTTTKVKKDCGHILKWPEAEVRRAYQARYRIFWQMPEWHRFHANYPCYPILDDHEIMDDWGSEPVHATPRFRDLMNGARWAYLDYQGTRVTAPPGDLPPSFHYSFEYGSVGVFVMDLRSERVAGPGGRLFSQRQFDDLRAFLARSADKRVLLLVASVPVIHLPDWLADVGASLLGNRVDFPDHWSYGPNRPQRDQFLRLVFEHQVAHLDQRVILVSGDVHIGCAFVIGWQQGGMPRLYQFTSSAVSNRLKKLKTEFSEIAPESLVWLKCGPDGPTASVGLLTPADGRPAVNPFGGLNVGIIEIIDRGDHAGVTLKLIGYPEGADRHVEMFASNEL